MSTPRLFAVDSAEPLGFVLLTPPEPRPPVGAVEVRFELSSRGDRVPGRLLLPAGDPLPFPWLLIQHGTRGSKDDATVARLSAEAVQRGLAVAAIDLPLHGERASAKLGERVLGPIERCEALSDLDAELWIDLVRQSVADLRRSVQALASHESLDADRLGFLGIGLGSAVGAAFCAEEPRVGTAVLAGGRGGIGPVGVDPIGHVGRIAPRPVLVMHGAESGEGPQSIYDATREPKQQAHYAGPDEPLPAAAHAEIWRFLDGALGLRPRG